MAGRAALLLRPVSRRKLDFEFDHLVPLRVAAIALGNGHKLAQAPARILVLRIGAFGLDRLWRCWLRIGR